MAEGFPYPTVVDILSELVALPSVNPMGGPADLSICFEGRVSDWLVDSNQTKIEFENLFSTLLLTLFKTVADTPCIQRSARLVSNVGTPGCIFCSVPIKRRKVEWLLSGLAGNRGLG